MIFSKPDVTPKVGNGGGLGINKFHKFTASCNKVVNFVSILGNIRPNDTNNLHISFMMVQSNVRPGLG